MRFRRRVDRVQPAMVEELRACGVTVIHTHGVGSKPKAVRPGEEDDGPIDAPDFIAGAWGATVLVEAKSPEYLKAHQERQARQAASRARWRGGPYVQASTAAEVLRALQEAARALGRDPLA